MVSVAMTDGSGVIGISVRVPPGPDDTDGNKISNPINAHPDSLYIPLYDITLERFFNTHRGGVLRVLFGLLFHHESGVLTTVLVQIP